MTIADDPRADPRLVATLTRLGLAGHPDRLPVDASSPRDQILAFCASFERAVRKLFATVYASVPPTPGVTRSECALHGPDGRTIKLYVHRAAAAREKAPPCVVHLHGGGMAVTAAADRPYTVLRDELAARGIVAVGVEFRNSTGIMGAHPFPAGLDDCEAAVRWVVGHRDQLGVGAVILAGESGGANLALSVALRAARDGWVEQIAGVYAQCPFIANPLSPDLASFPSRQENDGYFLSGAALELFAAAYDPDGDYADEVTCWPSQVAVDSLGGLPPHAISVNELDPLRDEGIAYLRKLRAAGASAIGQVVLGTCHAGDVLWRPAVPDLFEAAVTDIAAFAFSTAHHGCQHNPSSKPRGKHMSIATLSDQSARSTSEDLPTDTGRRAA